MPNEMTKQKLSVTVAPKIIDQVTRCAEQERRSRSNMVELLLEQALRQKRMWPETSPGVTQGTSLNNP